jgi:hypothetical protein
MEESDDTSWKVQEQPASSMIPFEFLLAFSRSGDPPCFVCPVSCQQGRTWLPNVSMNWRQLFSRASRFQRVNSLLVRDLTAACTQERDSQVRTNVFLATEALVKGAADANVVGLLDNHVPMFVSKIIKAIEDSSSQEQTRLAVSIYAALNLVFYWQFGSPFGWLIPLRFFAGPPAPALCDQLLFQHCFHLVSARCCPLVVRRL